MPDPAVQRLARLCAATGAGVTVRPDDPRLGIGMGLVLILAVSQLQSLTVATLALLLALVAGTLAANGAATDGSQANLWHRMWHVEAFMALLFVSLPFTVPGAVLFTLGPLTASAEGLALAALIAAKVTTAVVLGFVFLGRIAPQQLAPALRGLHLPERLVRLFVMTLRYLSVLRAEAARMQEAMRARGFRARSDRHTWRSLGNLAGMLILRALNRAGRVEEAMRCRGDAGRFPGIRLPPMGWTGAAWMGAALLVAIGLTVADRLWVAA